MLESDILGTIGKGSRRPGALLQRVLAPDYQVLYSTHSPFMVPSGTVEDVVDHRAGERPVVYVRRSAAIGKTAAGSLSTEFIVEIGLSPVQWKGTTASLAAVIDISERKRFLALQK